MENYIFYTKNEEYLKQFTENSLYNNNENKIKIKLLIFVMGLSILIYLFLRLPFVLSSPFSNKIKKIIKRRAKKLKLFYYEVESYFSYGFYDKTNKDIALNLQRISESCKRGFIIHEVIDTLIHEDLHKAINQTLKNFEDKYSNKQHFIMEKMGY